jgi:hypothetical protein
MIKGMNILSPSQNIFTVMDTSNSARKQYGAQVKYSPCSDEYYSPTSPSTKAACKDGKIVVKRSIKLPILIVPKYSLACRPKLEVADAEPSIPKCKVPKAEPMFPLPPFHQTPGPISISQVYLRRLILEYWEAELKACEKAK